MKLYPKVEKPILYFSGSGSSSLTEKKLIKAGVRHRCFSYAYTAPNAFYYQKKTAQCLQDSIDQGIGIMMDSGAASFHGLQKKGLRKTKGKLTVRDQNDLRDKVIEDYVKYVKANQKLWDFYLTFDYVKHCPTIFQVQKQLEKEGIRPVPVYHGDHGIEWFENYCKEGHKLICLGSIKRNHKSFRYYFDKVFNIADKYGVKLHGLAFTSLSLMFGFDWYSVDSTTWAKVAAYGCILKTTHSVKQDIIGYIHLSKKKHSQGRALEWCDLSKDAKRRITNEIADDGFDVEKLFDDGSYRSLYNVYVFANKLNELKEGIRKQHIKWQALSVR